MLSHLVGELEAIQGPEHAFHSHVSVLKGFVANLELLCGGWWMFVPRSEERYLAVEVPL